MGRMMDAKIQAVRKCLDAFELRVCCRPMIFFQKTRGILKLIEKMINSTKKMFFLDRNLIYLIVIYTHPNGTILLSHK